MIITITTQRTTVISFELSLKRLPHFEAIYYLCAKSLITMADNYLEKRMDEYHNGSSSNPIRKHKLPKKKTIWVEGVNCQAHVDVVRALCNGGHSVFCHNVAQGFSDAVNKTLAKRADSFADNYDVIVNNEPESTSVKTKGRIVVTCSNREILFMLPENEFSSASNHNFVVFPDKNNGQNLASMVRFLTDANTDIMNNQTIEVL